MRQKIKNKINLDEGWQERREFCKEKRRKNCEKVKESIQRKKDGTQRKLVYK